MAANWTSWTVFRVPTTHDVLTALFHPAYPKSHIDLVNLFLLGSQLVLFWLLPRSASRVFFLVYFAFWRAAYDAGLGWVLTQQSKRRWIVREVQRRGWLDENKRPNTRAWIREQLAGKMGKDYSFDVSPSGAVFLRIIVMAVAKRAAGPTFVSPIQKANSKYILIVRSFFQELPLEYNTWLLFRQLVDIILLKSVGPL
jgi:phosphatidylethanolamine N-methyltransferase